jgi:anti-sigma factor RsiW
MNTRDRQGCPTFSNDLDAYRDLALEPDRERAVRAHLEQCEHCRAELDHAHSIEAEIRLAATDWQPSPDLWEKVTDSAQRQLQQASTQQDADRERRRPLFAWMTAALLLITVGVTGFGLLKEDSRDTPEVVAAALINEFHTFVVSHRALDFSDTRPAEIRSWFGDKVDFRVPLPVKSADLKLAGGRLCNMLDQRIASFMYEVDDAWVSLYIMRSKTTTQGLGASQEVLLQGYAFIDWENQGLHYSLVGDLPVKRLREISEHLRSTHILTYLSGRPGTSAALNTGTDANNHRDVYPGRRHS